MGDSRLKIYGAERLVVLEQCVCCQGGLGLGAGGGSAVGEQVAGGRGSRKREPGVGKFNLGVKDGAEGDGGQRWPAGGLE